MPTRLFFLSIFLVISLIGNFIFLVLVFDFFKVPVYASGSLSDLQHLLKINGPNLAEAKNPTSVYFTGDILLGRNVELLMNQYGDNYPFKNFAEIFTPNPLIISNFESAIAPVHVSTPLFNTKFSVNKNYLPELKQSGVSFVSLANNHSLDYGQTGYVNTFSQITNNDIVPFGHPTEISSSSVIYFKVGNKTVSMIALHNLFTKIDPVKLAAVVKVMTENSDYQIAFVHSGTEYQLYHNDIQEKLAHQLIDLGIDAYIGHHPHVVQDIEVYKGKPIFYSLGNFIFDQYFSTDVEQELVLKLSFEDNNTVFNLIPVSSEGTRSQPHLMNEDENSLFLSNLSRRSEFTQMDNIKAGKLIFLNTLASSTLNGIISQ